MELVGSPYDMSHARTGELARVRKSLLVAGSTYGIMAAATSMHPVTVDIFHDREKCMSRAAKMTDIDPLNAITLGLRETHRRSTWKACLATHLANCDQDSHVPLNKYLHRIGRTHSPLCIGCKQEETGIFHYLQ